MTIVFRDFLTVEKHKHTGNIVGVIILEDEDTGDLKLTRLEGLPNDNTLAINAVKARIDELYAKGIPYLDPTTVNIDSIEKRVREARPSDATIDSLISIPDIKNVLKETVSRDKFVIKAKIEDVVIP